MYKHVKSLLKNIWMNEQGQKNRVWRAGDLLSACSPKPKPHAPGRRCVFVSSMYVKIRRHQHTRVVHAHTYGRPAAPRQSSTSVSQTLHCTTSHGLSAGSWAGHSTQTTIQVQVALVCKAVPKGERAGRGRGERAGTGWCRVPPKITYIFLLKAERRNELKGARSREHRKRKQMCFLSLDC